MHSVLGEMVTMPVEIRDADAASAMFLADAGAARTILAGTGLEPVTIAGRAICTLVFVRYVDGDLGPYHEFGLALMAQRPGDRSSTGIYISWLPVNQSFTCAAGREIWGFPKEIADIRITPHGRGKRCEVRLDGRLVVALQTGGVPAPATLGGASIAAYTHLDGVLRSTPWVMNPSGVRMRPGGARVELGDHPIAEQMRALGPAPGGHVCRRRGIRIAANDFRGCTGDRMKTALVTGAASGMGRMTAQRLAAAGYRVAAVDLNEAGLAETSHRSPNMNTYTCDVSDPAAVGAVVDKVRAELGPIEHLVHAAALCRVGSALTHDVSEMRRVMEVNYLGTINLCQAVIPAMKVAGSGTVVLFASLAGWLPSPGLGAYSASKFAVVGYTDVLSRNSPGPVCGCSVCPPHVETPLLDGIRETDAAVVAGQSGMSPEKVLDVMEKALANPKSPLFVFPGQARPLVLARRFVPNLLRKQVARMVTPTL